MKLIITFVTLSVCAFLVGCANQFPMGREKVGASWSDYEDARYFCIKDASQRVSTAAIGQFGGAATSSVTPSCQLYDACMSSKGFYMTQNGRFQKQVSCH